MAGKELRSKIRDVRKWLDSHPFVHWFQLTLIKINKNSAVILMPVFLKECTRDKVMTGGVHAVLGNAAGVALAMLHSSHFTPLAEIKNLKFYRPVVLEKDEELVAEAKFLAIQNNRIVIKVEIKNRKDDKLKADGIFEYALLISEYRT